MSEHRAAHAIAKSPAERLDRAEILAAFRRTAALFRADLEALDGEPIHKRVETAPAVRAPAPRLASAARHSPTAVAAPTTGALLAAVALALAIAAGDGRRPTRRAESLPGASPASTLAVVSPTNAALASVAPTVTPSPPTITPASPTAPSAPATPSPSFRTNATEPPVPTATLTPVALSPTAAPVPTATPEPPLPTLLSPTEPPPPALTPTPAFRATDRIVAPVPVNLRAGPGTGFVSLGALPSGTPLAATGESAQSGGYLWRRFRAQDGRIGWVRDIDVRSAR